MTIPHPRRLVKLSSLSNAGRDSLSGTDSAFSGINSRYRRQQPEVGQPSSSVPNTKLLGILVVVLAVALFGVFFWLYFSPVFRKNVQQRRRLTQINNAQRSQVKAYAATVMTPPSHYPSSLQGRERNSTVTVKKACPTGEEFMDPYVFDTAPSSSPTSLPRLPELSYRWHTRDERSDRITTHNQTLQPPSTEPLPIFTRNDSFKGLPPLPLLAPIVILSNSLDSLTKGEVLVSPQMSSQRSYEWLPSTRSGLGLSSLFLRDPFLADSFVSESPSRIMSENLLASMPMPSSSTLASARSQQLDNVSGTGSLSSSLSLGIASCSVEGLTRHAVPAHDGSVASELPPMTQESFCAMHDSDSDGVSEAIVRPGVQKPMVSLAASQSSTTFIGTAIVSKATVPLDRSPSFIPLEVNVREQVKDATREQSDLVLLNGTRAENKRGEMKHFLQRCASMNLESLHLR